MKNMACVIWQVRKTTSDFLFYFCNAGLFHISFWVQDKIALHPVLVGMFHSGGKKVTEQLGQFFERAGLSDKTRSTALIGFVDVFCIQRGGIDNHRNTLCSRIFTDLYQALLAVFLWHVQIHEDAVR